MPAWAWPGSLRRRSPVCGPTSRPGRPSPTAAQTGRRLAFGAVQDRALTATAVPATVVGTLLAGAASALLTAGLSVERLPWSLGAVVATAALADLLVTGACRLVSASLTARLRGAAALDHLRTP